MVVGQCMLWVWVASMASEDVWMFVQHMALWQCSLLCPLP